MILGSMRKYHKLCNTNGENVLIYKNGLTYKNGARRDIPYYPKKEET